MINKGIPSDIFSVLEGYGKSVGMLGYTEAKSKDNLFYKADGEITYFVDMRRYDFDESWTVPKPLFYYFSTVGGYDKDRVRVISEADMLIKNGVLISWDRNYFLHSWKYYCTSGFVFGFKNLYCFGCRASLKKGVSGHFCNSECEALYKKKCNEDGYNELPRCGACNKKIVPVDIRDWNVDRLEGHDESDYVLSHEIEHHVSYEPEEIMIVCRSCHAKITFRKGCKYAAVDSRPIIEKKFSLVPCTVPGCGSRARVAVGNDPGTAKCYRCKNGLQRIDKPWEDLNMRVERLYKEPERQREEFRLGMIKDKQERLKKRQRGEILIDEKLDDQKELSSFNPGAMYNC